MISSVSVYHQSGQGSVQQLCLHDRGDRYALGAAHGAKGPYNSFGVQEQSYVDSVCRRVSSPGQTPDTSTEAPAGRPRPDIQ